jgi:hypothetical protein
MGVDFVLACMALEEHCRGCVFLVAIPLAVFDFFLA